MKKRVFVGSSKEAEDVTNRVQSFLNKNKGIECVSWQDKSVFPLGETTYQSLIDIAITFDYAVFIASADDKVIRQSNSSEKLSARDNIYFEIGLFLGFLGKERVYILKEEGCTLATDLLGVTHLPYTKDSLSDDDKLASYCERIYDAMKESDGLYVSIKPASVSARGYYNNFILPLLTILNSNANPSLVMGDKKYRLKNIKEVKTYVIIPNVTEGMKHWKDSFEQRNGLQQAVVENYDLLCRVKVVYDENLSVLRIYDIPMTLDNSLVAIDELMRKNGRFDSTFKQNLVKKREIDTFYLALKYWVRELRQRGIYIVLRKESDMSL